MKRTGQVAKPEVHTPGDDAVVAGPVEKPWYDEAKKHDGENEYQSKLAALLVPFWKKLFGLNFKDLIGSPHAWCGLFVGAMLYIGHAEYTSRGASAIAYDSYGQRIEWQTEGIPQGAIVRINHDGDCKSASNNHVTFADGDCAAADLMKPNATFPGYGGNQGNAVKRSNYSVKEICSVRWPPDYVKPPRVAASKNCSGSKSAESTR